MRTVSISQKVCLFSFWLLKVTKKKIIKKQFTKRMKLELTKEKKQKPFLEQFCNLFF